MTAERPKTGRPVLVLLASRELRRGPASPLVRFARTFEHYFRHVRRPDIFILEGSYRALLQNGVLTGYSGLHPVAAGRQGGLVALADLIVQGTEDGRRVDEVVYLLDPRDATSMFPDSQAIKRECVVTRTAFLATEAAAAEWFALDWARRTVGSDADSPVRRWFAGRALADALLPEAVRHPAGRNVALIAHDAYKADMLEFGAERFDFLQRFERRFATGTTGGLLNGQLPDRIRERWDADETEAGPFSGGPLPPRLQKAATERGRVETAVGRLRERLGGRAWIEAQPSGPLGGDIRVAEAVRRRDCDTVLFFEDPHVSREHEADIQLLERATRIPGSEAICLHDADTVRRWADGWVMCMEGDVAPPLTVVDVFRRYWGVELVLATGPHRGAARSGWGGVADAMAWYVNALLENELVRARERSAAVRAAVGWGRGMSEVLKALAGLRDVLRRRQGQQSLGRPLIADRASTASWLTVQPTIGILGLPDPVWEANRNAETLADLYGGQATAITEYAFPRPESRTPKAPDSSADLDAVLLTAGHLGNQGLPLPAPLSRDLGRNAVGEIGGLVLSADGRDCQPSQYARVGLAAADLGRVRRAGRAVVLAAGRHPDELGVTLAALDAGLLSTLVTDLEFAGSLLKAAACGPDAVPVGDVGEARE